MNVIDRFLRYVSYPSASDESPESVPSTPGQQTLARGLAEELRELGVQDAAAVDAFGRVYGHLS